MAPVPPLSDLAKMGPLAQELLRRDTARYSGRTRRKRLSQPLIRLGTPVLPNTFQGRPVALITASCLDSCNLAAPIYLQVAKEEKWQPD